jgi:tetratricopeptide (TPR) repeat protein
VSRSITKVRRKKKDADPLRSAWHILEDWLEVNRRQIVTLGGIAVGTVLVVGLLWYFLDYRKQVQLQAFNDAYSKFTATVGPAPAAPAAAGVTPVTFPDAQTKYTEAANAFEKLGSDYSSFRDVANYYAGVSYLEIRPERGVELLQPIADGTSELRYYARLALGEYYSKSGAFDKSEPILQKLSDEPGPIPRFYILTRLGKVKESLSKPGEAAPLYKMIVDADRNGTYGPEAERGLQRVDPAAAAALPPKNAPQPGGNPSNTVIQGGPGGSVPGMPPGGLPGGMPGF